MLQTFLGYAAIGGIRALLGIALLASRVRLAASGAAERTFRRFFPAWAARRRAVRWAGMTSAYDVGRRVRVGACRRVLSLPRVSLTLSTGACADVPADVFLPDDGSSSPGTVFEHAASTGAFIVSALPDGASAIAASPLGKLGSPASSPRPWRRVILAVMPCSDRADAAIPSFLNARLPTICGGQGVPADVLLAIMAAHGIGPETSEASEAASVHASDAVVLTVVLSDLTEASFRRRDLVQW